MWRIFLLHWRRLVLIVIPLVLLPLILPTSTEVSKCAYCVLVMAIFWISEALPLAVTALLPVVIFPLFGILSTNEVCVLYLKETNMMFLGGLMVAIAVEESGLHLRLALRVLVFVGATPRWIMLGFMATTSFLSMWINNTATTAMMVPIIDAVIEQLKSGHNLANNSQENLHHGESVDSGLADSQISLASNGISTVEIELKEIKDVEIQNTQNEEQKPISTNFARLRLGLFLSIAYACNIGGTGALNGTAPNLVLKGILEQNFGSKSGLNFATFTMFTFPTMIICVLVAWIWLQIMFIRPLCSCHNDNSTERGRIMKKVIKEKYEELGRITFHEIEVIILFFILILLWLLRDPKFIEGWQVYFPIKKVEDSTVVMAIVILLFALPAKPPWKSIKNDNHTPIPSALTWKAVHQKLPWNVILLIGGGFALAEASKVSGLSAWLGTLLVVFEGLPSWAVVTVVCLMTAGLTEVASNTATATIILPVLANMSRQIKLHPLYTMLPSAVACSYAFTLPIGTPPNAIVFSSAKMKPTDMMLPGFVMNLMCVGIITLMINTLGVYMFDLNEYPSWADLIHENSTSSVNSTAL